MKKRSFLLLLLLLATALTSAQTDISSQLSGLQKARNDDEKLKAYYEVISYYTTVNDDSGTYYAEQALKFATEHKRQLDMAHLLKLLATIDRLHGTTSVAEQRLKAAMKIYRDAGNKKGIAEITDDFGGLEFGKGNMDKAIRLLTEALVMQDSMHDKAAMFLTLTHLGKVYMQQIDSGSTMKYLNWAIEIKQIVAMSDETISLYNTLGVFYAVAVKDKERALSTFLADLELSKTPQFMKAHAECLLYLGNFYLEDGKPDLALHYLQDGLKLAQSHKLVQEEAEMLVIIAAAIGPVRPDSALVYLHKAQDICNQAASRPYLLVVYDEIANLYRAQGKYKEALEQMVKKILLKDSIYNLDRAREIAAINAEYEFEKANAKIADLETANNKHERERDIVIIVAVIFIALAVALLYFYRRISVLNRRLVTHERELEQANNMKSRLLSIIGHDLRAPIASIPTVLDIFEDADTTEEERNMLAESLREQAVTISDTLDKLLLWGQSVIKGVMINRQVIKPKAITGDAIEFLKHAALEKSIAVVDDTADLSIYADPTHFDFVIRNLLANAIKYTFRSGHIFVNADRNAQPGFTVFSVKDDGMGMDAATQKQIFNTASSTYGTANEKGTGIGLMLCKEFIVLNGGTIWVESEVGKGATFYFSFKNTA